MSRRHSPAFAIIHRKIIHGVPMRQGRSTFLANRLRELAWGCGFGALLTPPAVHALSLEGIRVRSHLGQPFEAVIPVGRAPNETLESACFSVAAAGDALPGIGRVRASFDRARSQLVLRSPALVREPLSEITVSVRCASAPALDRTFLVVLDPPQAATDSALARADDAGDTSAASAPPAGRAAQPVRAVSEPPATRDAPVEPPVARASEPVGLPSPRRAARPPAVAIEAGSRYLVLPGDTLSSVAERVRGRPAGTLWRFAAQIHARNLSAFVDGNPDRLRAGVTLVIPSIGTERPAGEAAMPPVQTASTEPVALAPREPANAPVVDRFALSTTLSGESLQRIRSRQDDAEATQPATARVDALAGTAQDVHATYAADAVASISGAQGAGVVADGDAAGVAAGDAARAAVSRAEPAPIAQAAPQESASDGPAHPGSWLRWIVTALGAVLVGAVLGGIGVRIVIWRRQAAELHRRQSMRRASGLERSIRLDHGIIVKEHPAGTPLTVDASTQEIAAIRPAAAPPAPIRAMPAAASVPTLPPEAGLLDFATESHGAVTLELEGPLTDLDLLLPEVSETATGLHETPTVAAATTPSETLDASRQYSVDTDLMELAYRDETIVDADPDATVRLETQAEAVILDDQDAVAADALTSDLPEDTVLDTGRADVATVIALRGREDTQELVAPKRARASRKA
jgi:hypothetical protein